MSDDEHPELDGFPPYPPKLSDVGLPVGRDLAIHSVSYNKTAATFVVVLQTDLPEGREVELVIVDDEFEPEERARLLQAIEDGDKDIEKGDYVDGIEFANELLARRETSSR